MRNTKIAKMKNIVSLYSNKIKNVNACKVFLFVLFIWNNWKSHMFGVSSIFISAGFIWYRVYCFILFRLSVLLSNVTLSYCLPMLELDSSSKKIWFWLLCWFVHVLGFWKGSYSIKSNICPFPANLEKSHIILFC